MFKRGDIVRFAEEWCTPEERKYLLIVVKERGDTMLVEYLNGKTLIKVQECVQDYMVVKVMDAEEYLETVKQK